MTNTIAASTATPNHRLPHVVFITVNNGGHVSPMITVAKEMALRGFARVTVATNDEGRSIIENECGGLLQFSSAGPTPDVAYEETVVFNPHAPPLEVLASLQSFWGKFNEIIFETLKNRWTLLTENNNSNVNIDGSTDISTNGSSRPDFLVCDNLTTACHDLAEFFHLPYATIGGHSIGIMGLASSFDVHMAHYLPMEFTVFSRSIKMNWLEHMITPLGKLLLQIPFRSNYLLLGQRNALRTRNGLPKINKWLATTTTKAVPSGKALTIIYHSWAVEYPTLLPPFIHMVGPLIKSTRRESSIEADLLLWLDHAIEHSITVVYCSFSTAVKFNPVDTKHVLEVISDLPSTYKVLWSLRDQVIALENVQSIPDNLRLENFVAQAEVLAHPAVKVFWSHAGTNSMYESIIAGVPILAMPFFADQHANAQHLIDHGAALKVDPTNLDIIDTTSKIHRLAAYSIAGKADNGNTNDFLDNIKKLQQIIRHDGGAKRAVDLLHMVIELGSSEHLVPKQYNLPWFQYYALDLHLFWVFMLFVIAKGATRAIFKCFQRNSQRGKENLKKD